MNNKRFWAVLALAAVLVALAFFLPPQVSRWYDQQLMDEPKVTQVEDREGLADSIRLTVAEKLMLLQSGNLSFLALPGEEAEVRYIIEDGSGGAYISSEPEVDEPIEGDEEWETRLTGVKRELLALQRTGGLPELWTEDTNPELISSGEMLYIDNNTQVSFLVYHMELSFSGWGIGVTVDDSSGKILSMSLRWSRATPPSWGAAGAANFGSAWRDYWGMDSVDPSWNTPRINELLSSSPLTSNSEYSAAGEISFTYDGQTLRASLYGWCSGGNCAVQWNT